MKSLLVRNMPSTGAGARNVALNRRRFLSLAGGVAGGAILAACGGSNATDTPRAAATNASTAATSAAPTVNAAATRVGSAVSGVAPTVASAATAAAPSVNAAATTVIGAATSAAPTVNAAATTASTSGSAIAGTTAAAGSASAGGAGQALVIEATEYAFKTLGSIPAGATTVQLRNLGKERHEAQFVRLNDGVTVEQFLTAIQQAGEGEPPPIFSYEGGAAEIMPNKTGEVMLNFQAGQYMLLCFVSAPDGQPHVAKGMILPLKVNAATGAAAALPAGKGTIALGAVSGFDLPATLPAGKSQYRVTNQGSGPRAFFYGSIPADKTIDDVNAELAKPDSPPPPWFQQAGGMDGLKPNGTGVVTLDLAPGKYVAVDIAFGPDKPFGKIFTVG